MELFFKGKESKEDILQRTSDAEPIIIDAERSYIVNGDNFDVMSRMLKSNKGYIDLVYIDPPFNTNQSFAVSSNRANTISREKNSTIAYSDLMTDDEYIKFMYERLVLIYELLSDEGSLYVHIDTKTGHYLKIILDEIFGVKNFKNDIL